jgi:hypothetical protein
MTSIAIMCNQWCGHAQITDSFSHELNLTIIGHSWIPYVDALARLGVSVPRWLMVMTGIVKNLEGSTVKTHTKNVQCF